MNLQRGIKIAGLGVLFAGSAAFAQSSPNYLDGPQPLTRAEVRQQVIDLKAVGYRPEITTNILYPDDVLEAQRRSACKQAVQANGGGQAEWSQRCNIRSTITIVNP
ncbi:DUF4148 domain-containing protein [Paraburkholderia unamae]|uniref:Uncharacterized protein DUF4148 n=1 Tax=Paraburkholderia unamae TaxID=219649 RepID=A0ABX5KQL7_9BURK|nr:DUF4148 domain-containing protein [Paraburkholderia unamae]PVX84964.1 uncharacterized protein DUF4148 [Paraburkholderia unamae]